MGGHHAATGAAAWVAFTSTAPYALGIHPVSPLGVVAGSLVCAGAALLPDADHPSATIAQSLPPVSTVLTRWVSAISGGHRHGTHSLLAVGVFSALAYAAGLVQINLPHFGPTAFGAAVTSMVLVAFAAKALKLIRGAWSGWILGIFVSLLVAIVSPTDWNWLPWAVGLGTFVHLVGDAMTTGGVPWLWPWVPKPPKWWRKAVVLRDIWHPNGYAGLPVLGNAGSTREWILLVPVSLYAVVGVVDAGLLGVEGLSLR